jgi:hypothetical protein
VHKKDIARSFQHLQLLCCPGSLQLLLQVGNLRAAEGVSVCAGADMVQELHSKGTDTQEAQKTSYTYMARANLEGPCLRWC